MYFQRPVIECPSSPESDDQSAYTSYTSDQSAVYYPSSPGHVTHVIHDDGVDSDGSNFDVIPFSESEYEKITVDTDTQTDVLTDDNSPTDAEERESGVLIPCNRGDGSGRCEGMEYSGTDSALGRSVSDHSINTDPHRHSNTISHSSIRLSHDKFKQVIIS